MSFLLMVGLTLVCLPKTYAAPWIDLSPVQGLYCCVGYVALVGLHAFWVSRRVSWPLARYPSRRDAVLDRYERGRRVHQIVLIGLYFFTLTALGWGWAVREAWSGESSSWPGTELLTLAPFFVAQILGWVFFYDADRAAQRAAHHLIEDDTFAPNWLEARQVPSSPFHGRSAYVLFELRQKLAFVFMAVFLVVAYKELERLFPESSTQWPLLVQGLSAGVMACVLLGWPLMIRFVLSLQPLPPGPLRDRLTSASARLGFRCSNVLVWNTSGGMANAMIVGLVPWLRYVIFTDRLLEEFSEDEIEAVFGHEIGHVRHQHMPYYLGFLALSLGAIGLLADHVLLPALGRLGVELSSLLPGVVSESMAGLFGPDGDLAPVPVVLLILAYLFTAFGFLSRSCERQADVFGCRAVSGERPDGSHFCPSGIAIFIRALEKVALVNGISRDKPGFFQSWQHGSIAGRVEFLERASRHPEIEARFQRRLGLIKWGVVVVLGGILAGMVWGLKWTM
jgi:Zn-dependent protease with chaperone function